MALMVSVLDECKPPQGRSRRALPLCQQGAVRRAGRCDLSLSPLGRVWLGRVWQDRS